jgi:hypothetical protein
VRRKTAAAIPALALLAVAGGLTASWLQHDETSSDLTGEVSIDGSLVTRSPELDSAISVILSVVSEGEPRLTATVRPP